MWTGIRSLLIVAAAFYLASWLALSEAPQAFRHSGRNRSMTAGRS